MLHIPKLHLGHVTLHLGHVIDGASQMKNDRFSFRKTALRTNTPISSSEHTKMHLCHVSSVPNDFLQRRSIHSIWLSKFFAHSIAIILRTKLLSHDLNAFWCVRLTSRDVMKTAVRVATSTVHLGHVTPSKIAFRSCDNAFRSCG